MNDSPLAQAIRRWVHVTQALADADLERPWAWRAYDSEGIRFAFFRTYEELRELDVKLRRERDRRGRPASAAQLILAQYHSAYIDLQAALLPARPEQSDQIPAEGEWPPGKVLAHIVGADLGFYVAVKYALDQHRAGASEPTAIPDEAWDAITGMDEAAYRSLMNGPFEGLQSYHQLLHALVLQDFAGIDDAELELPSRYWENEPMSLRFRLHRFESHMRQHTIQMDKTLSRLQLFPSEAQRLLRLIYAALAEVDGVHLGMPELDDLEGELADVIQARAEELARILGSDPIP